MPTLYRLSLAARFLDPAWFNARPSGRVIVSDNGVTLQGERLQIDGEVVNENWTTVIRPTRLADGTEVEVYLDSQGFFVCTLAAEADALRAHQAAQEAAEKNAALRRAHQEITAARTFNQTLPIPVPWHPHIKDVLSGLLRDSRGDGRNQRTVVHVRLEAAIHEGRFHRDAGDFLCTSTSKNNGKQWANHAKDDARRVTCAACLKLAARWTREG